DYVLQRPTQLDADHVVVGVQAKARIAEGLLYMLGEGRVSRGDGDRRGVTAGDLLGEGRATQGADAEVGSKVSGQDLGDDLSDPQVGAFLEPLGRADKQHLGCAESRR